MQKTTQIWGGAAACLLAIAAGAAHAAPLTETFTYQGELMDGGTPADGLFDLEFRLFDAASGGSIIGSPRTYTAVDVEGGLFTQAVNFGGVGVLYTGERTWLEVSIRPSGSGSYTVLGPRQELTTTPYASYALNAGFAEGASGADYADESGFAYDTESDLDDIYQNGRAIRAVNGPVIIENTSDDAELQLGDTRGGGRGLLTTRQTNGEQGTELSSIFAGGYVNGFSPTGGLLWSLFPDTSPGGGSTLSLYRRSGAGTGTAVGFLVDGNYAGSEETRVTINGDSNAFQFNADLTGNGAAVMPVGSVDAQEMFNEPGVASALSTTGTILTSSAATTDTVLSRSIVCPTDGYVLVIGSCEARMIHSNGSGSSMNIGVSDTEGALPFNQDVEFYIAPAAATGTYEIPATVHGLFQVSAGTRTFYLLGDYNSGSNAVMYDSQLSLVFIPTSYGSVAPTVMAPDDGGDAYVAGPMTAREIEAERAEAIIANELRVAEELEAMRLRVQRLQAELEAMAGSR